MKPGRWKDLGEGVRRALGRLRDAVRPQEVPSPGGPPKLGLALGGGFARGMSHIGVIKALEDAQIPISFIAGTSIGSIIGGAYASGATVEEMATIGAKVRWHDFGKWTISKMGLASNKRLEALVRQLFRATRFEDLRIPLAIVATDLATGRPVVFTEGGLSLPIRASCAYPGLFLPIPHEETFLVDGGLVRTVPTISARDMGAEIVLGVALNNLNPSFTPRHIADVLSRSFTIAMQAAEPIWRRHADLIAEPQVETFGWDAFDRTPELIEAGEAAVRRVLPQLRDLMGMMPRQEKVSASG